MVCIAEHRDELIAMDQSLEIELIRPTSAAIWKLAGIADFAAGLAYYAWSRRYEDRRTWPIGFIVGGGCALYFAWIVVGGLFANASIQNGYLGFDVPVYGRLITMESLQLSQARTLDWQRHEDWAEYAPTRRTNGLGVGGYEMGRFKLRNGDKALAFLTDAHNIIYIPTTEGYSLLLSIEKPDLVMDRLATLRPRS